MIGWYIHHQGRGHLHRATAVARAAAEAGLEITGLSSLPEPTDWPGADWVQLERDDTATRPEPRDATASGALHWVPRHHPGLLRRSAQVSAWLDAARPALVVADVSVEMALLVRLHGVPVVTVALPGDRTDRAHQLGYAVSERVVGMWPAEAANMLHGAEAVHALGGLSRFAPQSSPADASSLPHAASRLHASPLNLLPLDVLALNIVVLSGGGGGSVGSSSIARLRRMLPSAEIVILGGDGSWEHDPWPQLVRADLVVTAAGQNSIAEVAASRTPALVTALDRPHQEQQRMLAALERGPWPAVRMPDPDDDTGWTEALTQVLRRDGQDWSSWCDGGAAVRFADLLQDLVAQEAPHQPGMEVNR
ncbi:glycosyl transferase [Nesterenkonia lutea]|uniref:Glycosyl transferase family 28 C-terminal domain-containing protein n=1 Tax=Nesterenkonia lutea TaxID=272919 RepID=A0ABR9JFA7_9MICC|nr:glycosyl transferase [Nesterenkonia lutea]MBE1524609.1 hypothetical protein [Nesterenkonia lutea]